MRLFIPFVQNSRIRTTYPISTWSDVAYALYLSRVCNELQLLDGLDSFERGSFVLYHSGPSAERLFTLKILVIHTHIVYLLEIIVRLTNIECVLGLF